MKNNTNVTALSMITFVAFILLSSAVVSATNFVKGTHYNVLSTPLNDPPSSAKEVREFFSSYCPGCYRQEPIFSALKVKLPANVPFIKNHIEGMPGRDVAIEEALSKALLTAQLLKVEETITAAIFINIQVNKANFSDDKDIKNIFLLHGIDEQRFDEVFNSFNVKTRVNKMRKVTGILRKQGLSRVPTVIVNGKYQVETGSIKSKQEYIELVLYLLNIS